MVTCYCGSDRVSGYMLLWLGPWVWLHVIVARVWHEFGINEIYTVQVYTCT